MRLSLRYIRQRPAYAITCITVLALGLGTSTAVFSALYSAVLKPLPYPDPDGLVLDTHVKHAGQHHSRKAGGSIYFLFDHFRRCSTKHDRGPLSLGMRHISTAVAWCLESQHKHSVLFFRIDTPRLLHGHPVHA